MFFREESTGTAWTLKQDPVHPIQSTTPTEPLSLLTQAYPECTEQKLTAEATEEVAPPAPRVGGGGGGETSNVLRQLAEPDFLPLDSSDDPRVPIGMVTETTVPSPNTFPTHDPRRTGIDEPGDHGPSDERSHSTLHNWFRVYFLVPKKDGGWHPVINLKMLNSYIVTQHFKMETISNMKDVIKQGDWLGKIDLKDTYLTIPVHPPDQKYLKFMEETGLPIHFFTLRSVNCTESLLEGDATSDGSAEGERGTDDPVPGRCPSTFRVEGEALLPHADGGYCTRRSTVPIEQEEVPTDPLPGNKVPGVHVQLGQPVPHPARGESQEIKKECRRLLNSLYTSGGDLAHLISLLSSTTAAEPGGHLQRRQLRNRVHCRRRVSHGFEVMGGPSRSPQRPADNAPLSRIGALCQQERRNSFEGPITQMWYPLLLEMLVDEPVILPQNHTLLSNPHKSTHPCWPRRVCT